MPVMKMRTKEDSRIQEVCAGKTVITMKILMKGKDWVMLRITDPIIPAREVRTMATRAASIVHVVDSEAITASPVTAMPDGKGIQVVADRTNHVVAGQEVHRVMVDPR